MASRYAIATGNVPKPENDVLPSEEKLDVEIERADEAWAPFWPKKPQNLLEGEE
jgi:hypothetical protein